MQEIVEPDSGGGESGNKVQKTNIRFTFRGANPGGEERIDKFIQECFDAYMQKMKNTQDFSR